LYARSRKAAHFIARQQLLSIAVLFIAKKSAARWSRAKSTPKEEGGGDNGKSTELLNSKALKLNEFYPSPMQRSRNNCALHHMLSKVEKHTAPINKLLYLNKSLLRYKKMHFILHNLQNDLTTPCST
jgi:hypothetical protein